MLMGTGHWGWVSKGDPMKSKFSKLKLARLSYVVGSIAITVATTGAGWKWG